MKNKGTHSCEMRNIPLMKVSGHSDQFFQNSEGGYSPGKTVRGDIIPRGTLFSVTLGTTSFICHDLRNGSFLRRHPIFVVIFGVLTLTPFSRADATSPLLSSEQAAHCRIGNMEQVAYSRVHVAFAMHLQNAFLCSRIKLLRISFCDK